MLFDSSSDLKRFAPSVWARCALALAMLSGAAACSGVQRADAGGSGGGSGNGSGGGPAEARVTVEVDTVERARVGSRVVAEVSVSARDGYELTDGYPHRVEVRVSCEGAEDVQRLRVQDAIERTPDRIAFRHEFVAPAAGLCAIAARVQYSVCTRSTCYPGVRELSWSVEVER